MVEEDEKYEEDERKSKKGKWYVIYDGPFRALYNNWAIVSHHVTGHNIKHQSFSTKEEAEKSLKGTEQVLKESYREMAMKQKAEPTTSQKRLVMKIPSISIKDIPTTRQKEEANRPTLQKFQQCWEDLLNYKEIHTTMGFYPTFKGGPRAVIITDKIAPTTLFALHQYGLIDTIYTQKTEIFDEFPTKFKTVVKRYSDSFSKGREIYLRYTASYPVFNKEELIVPSKAIIKMGVSNGNYPTRDELEGTKIPEDYQVRSLYAVSQALYYLNPTDNIKVNYTSTNKIIISNSKNQITAEEWGFITDQAKDFINLEGTLAPLTSEQKQQLCELLQLHEDHICTHCAADMTTSTSSNNGVNGEEVH
ncbi:unnamed protein product [Linum trigynum]|uniref:Ribonuclease H1 N-terminal domain-containing protein n=1 Tax=Linum trigynum TaxID=586398 RepID=A0AAV2EBX3_9ROSI